MGGVLGPARGRSGAAIGVYGAYRDHPRRSYSGTARKVTHWPGLGPCRIHTQLPQFPKHGYVGQNTHAAGAGVAPTAADPSANPSPITAASRFILLSSVRLRYVR